MAGSSAASRTGSDRRPSADFSQRLSIGLANGPSHPYLRLPILGRDAGGTGPDLFALAEAGPGIEPRIPDPDQRDSRDQQPHSRASAFASARRVAEHLLTIPIHRWLSDDDKRAIADCVGTGGSRDVPQAGAAQSVLTASHDCPSRLLVLGRARLLCLSRVSDGAGDDRALQEPPGPETDRSPRASRSSSPAHNEEGRIRDKIDNTLAQDYPAAGARGHRRLGLLERPNGRDRHAATRRASAWPGRRSGEARKRRNRIALESASGEIVIFSDVATALAPDGVSTMVANFADPTVGCVSSVDRFIDADGQMSGEGAYVRYEMLLRALETRVNSLVGLSGSFFAARRRCASAGPPIARATSTRC